MPNPDKFVNMLIEYFGPYVNFNVPKISDENSNVYCLKEIQDVLDNYIETIDGELYLDIPRMAGRDLFASLFPESDLVRKHTADLDKIKKSGKRQNIIEYFIKKDDEKFAAELNTIISSSKFDIVPGETLAENFLSKELFCSYSVETDDNGILKEEFIWEFPDFGFFHSVKSVYKAFRSHTHKTCTLYLFGADYYKFRECPKNWTVFDHEGKSRTLPEYLSKDKKEYRGLDEKFTKTNAGDFVWKEKDSEWNETDSIKHLLELFGLAIDIKVSLKEIYHSFCIPLLKKRDCLKLSNKIRFIAFVEFGLDIIKNTLLRRPDLSGWQIRIYRAAWFEIINNILEGTYTYILKGTKIKESIYRPTPFEVFIKQAAGQSVYAKEREGKIRAAEQQGTLDDNDRANIKDYFIELLDLVSEEDREELYIIDRDGNAYDMIKVIYDFIMSDNHIKAVFQNRYAAIEALYKKAFPVRIDNNWITDDGEELQQEPEDTKHQKPDEKSIGEELKNLVIECFVAEFDQTYEEEWRQFIRKEDPNTLFDDLDAYPRRTQGRLQTATDSNLFKNYCRIMHININNAKTKTRKHTAFAERMRNITDALEIRLKEAGYWR